MLSIINGAKKLVRKAVVWYLLPSHLVGICVCVCMYIEFHSNIMKPNDSLVGFSPDSFVAFLVIIHDYGTLSSVY